MYESEKIFKEELRFQIYYDCNQCDYRILHCKTSGRPMGADWNRNDLYGIWNRTHDRLDQRTYSRSLLSKNMWEKRIEIKGECICSDYILPKFCYKAVPFLGMKKESMLTFSKVNSFIFLSIPPAYPVKLPLLPTTLWQGTMMEISLCPTAPPTA